MDNLPEITIHKIIVHKVDHKLNREPILSDLESPLTDEVRSFLRQHIISNREHNRAHKATFINMPNPISILCDEILVNSNSFVDRSKDIANLLFRAMFDGRGNIVPGDLVICTYTENGIETQHLALLKMEPEDGFVGKRENVNGRIRVILERVPEVLPTKELQKCAFILPANLRQERGYDLIILDQQTARFGIRRPVASFFQSGFLQCKTGLHPKEQTHIFIYQSQAWLKQKKDELAADDIERFKQRTTEIVQSNVVDVTTFAQETLADPEMQNEYLVYMQDKGLEGLTFVPDPQEREKWTGYIWFRGDDDLEIRIRTNAVGEGRTLFTRKDEATNTYIVTIRTTVWEDFRKRNR
jgi:hypothetical protein